MSKGYHQTYGANADGALLVAIRSPEGKVICTVPLRSTTGSEWDGGKGIEQAKADAKLIVDALNAHRDAEPTPPKYTYSRGSDGVDDTWDIYDPDENFLVSIRFWDGNDDREAEKAEARANLIVETLNKGYWW